MPNWTRNWITYTGSKENLEKVKDLMGESFDFNKIIPMPECLDVVSGSVTTEAIIAYIASLHGGIEHVEESKEAMRFLRKQTFLDFNIDDMNEDIENAIRKNLPFAAQAFLLSLNKERKPARCRLPSLKLRFCSFRKK